MQEKLTTNPFYFLLPPFCPHPSTSRKKEGSDAQRAEPNPEKTKAVFSLLNYTVFVSQHDSKWGSAAVFSLFLESFPAPPAESYKFCIFNSAHFAQNDKKKSLLYELT